MVRLKVGEVVLIQLCKWWSAGVYRVGGCIEVGQERKKKKKRKKRIKGKRCEGEMMNIQSQLFLTCLR